MSPASVWERRRSFSIPTGKILLYLGDRIQGAIAVGDEIFHIEQTLRNKSGEFFPADINVSLFRIDERVVSVTAIVRDITNRKRAEQEIQLYQERLKALACPIDHCRGKGTAKRSPRTCMIM